MMFRKLSVPYFHVGNFDMLNNPSAYTMDGIFTAFKFGIGSGGNLEHSTISDKRSNIGLPNVISRDIGNLNHSSIFDVSQSQSSYWKQNNLN